MMVVLMVACGSDHMLAHVDPERITATEYQSATVSFMCDFTVAGDDPDCYAALPAHWAFCVAADDLIDTARACACVDEMHALMSVPDPFLPDECAPYQVVLPARPEGAGCD